jgi:hypothetical protein
MNDKQKEGVARILDMLSIASVISAVWSAIAELAPYKIWALSGVAITTLAASFWLRRTS